MSIENADNIKKIIPPENLNPDGSNPKEQKPSTGPEQEKKKKYPTEGNDDSKGTIHENYA